jgi:hypothetical protein
VVRSTTHEDPSCTVCLQSGVASFLLGLHLLSTLFSNTPFLLPVALPESRIIYVHVLYDPRFRAEYDRITPLYDSQTGSSAMESRSTYSKYATGYTVRGSYPDTQWRTDGGGYVRRLNPPPPPSPKFRSFDKSEPNSQFRGKYIRNNLIRIRVSLICKMSGTPDWGLPPPDPRSLCSLSSTEFVEPP